MSTTLDLSRRRLLGAGALAAVAAARPGGAIFDRIYKPA